MVAGWRKAAAAALPPLLFLALSVALFGRHVVGSPSTKVVGDAGSDKTIAMWSLSWWPRAIARGIDPFAADVVWAPHGIDLAWATAIPLPALVATPLTLAAGPVVAYNALALAAPALAAWTSFGLARLIGASLPAATVGGLVFGFSPFHTNHTVGHINLTLTFLIPLAGILVALRVQQRMRRSSYVLSLVAVLAGQFLVSTELFLMLVLAGATVAGLGVWCASAPERVRLGLLLRETVVAVALSLVLVSPYLLHAFVLSGTEHQPLRSPAAASIDLANLVVPTRRVWLSPEPTESIVARFAASPVERTGYLGVPLLVALAAAAGARRRSPLDTALLSAGAVLAVASLGPRIRVAGFDLFPGPWLPFAHLPVLGGALPARLSLFVSLLAALVLARWLGLDRRRWVIGGLVVLSLAPVASKHLWTADVPRPAFFAADRDERHLHRGDTALVFPYGPVGWSLLWQAEDAFRYRLVGGHFGRRATPEEEEWRDYHHGLAGGPLPRGGPRRLALFLEAHQVDVIVTTPGTRPGLRRLVESLHLPATRSGDAVVYGVEPGVR